MLWSCRQFWTENCVCGVKAVFDLGYFVVFYKKNCCAIWIQTTQHFTGRFWHLLLCFFLVQCLFYHLVCSCEIDVCDCDRIVFSWIVVLEIVVLGRSFLSSHSSGKLLAFCNCTQWKTHFPLAHCTLHIQTC